MDNQKIEENLIELDNELAEIGVQNIELYVLGGSAAILLGMGLRTTTDIDVMTNAKAAVKEMFGRFNINDDVSVFYDYTQLRGHFIEYNEEYTNIKVFVPTPELLLIIKQFSLSSDGRDKEGKERDEMDIRYIMKEKLRTIQLKLAFYGVCNAANMHLNKHTIETIKYDLRKRGVNIDD